VHLLQGNDPTVYQVAQAHSNWRATSTAIELPAVDGPAGVVDGDDAPSLGLCIIRATLLQHFIIDAFGKGFHTLLLGFVLQPLAVGYDVFALGHILGFYLLAMENLVLLLL